MIALGTSVTSGRLVILVVISSKEWWHRGIVGRVVACYHVLLMLSGTSREAMGGFLDMPELRRMLRNAGYVERRHAVGG